LKDRRMSITPHTLKLIDFSNPHDPLLSMAVPQEQELSVAPEELLDPIGDDAKSPVPFLTHRYSNRVLIHTTFFCAQFCRFCFRRSKTGSANPGPSQKDVECILNYLREHLEVEEVILTGGDPLTLNDEQLGEWFRVLREIPSVRRIRIHTRVLVNLPSRITDALLVIFKQYSDVEHPLSIVTHFNHPNEIASENIQAVAKLVDAGIVVRNQHPLLRGINDDAQVLLDLYTRLLEIHVAPYYLHQLDLAQGTNHFRVPLERGMQIMQTLRGYLPGHVLPLYVLDIPGGKGKVPIVFHHFKKVGERSWYVKDLSGGESLYVEPLECS